MKIRIRKTGAVVTEHEFRSMYPTTSFPPILTVELLDSFDADPVLEGAQATPTTPYQFSMRQGVEEVGGQWFTKYVLGPIFTDTEEATAAEQEAAYKAQKDTEQATSVRADRNRKIAESDWTQLPDSPVDKAAWAAYRQALRDLTAQAGFPWKVNWPEMPK